MKKKSKKYKGEKKKVDLGKKGSFEIHKGALHKALKVPEGEKIPASKMKKGAHSKSAKVRREVASAKGLKAMHHKKPKEIKSLS